MRVIESTAELNPDARGVCVAIGVFDGVHFGHQLVLRHTVLDAGENGAMPVALTFDRHPNAVVAPVHAPDMIYPIEKRLEAFAAAGIQTACVIHFDEAFSRIPGEAFARSLATDFRPLRSVWVGRDFFFGHRRSGNLETLQRLGRELGFAARAAESYSMNGQPVSSTRIRESIRAGEFTEASRMLGRPYSLCGHVVEGDRLGRTFGFPTANLEIAGLVLPPAGVYAARARVDGSEFRAVVNLGTRPTLRSPTPRFQVEAHLLDFHADIYGRFLELTLVQKVREEQRFPNIDALKKQIAADISAAARLL